MTTPEVRSALRSLYRTRRRYAMELHVLRLAKEYELELVFDRRGGKGKASRRDRRVNIAPIKSEISYIVALHEIAHVVGPEQSSRHRRIVQEIAAWEWALEQSIVPLKKSIRRKVSRSLSSYVSSYFWHKRAWLPSPAGSDGAEYDAAIWKRMERLLRLSREDRREELREADNTAIRLASRARGA